MHELLAAVVALIGVNVVPMDTERVLPAQTVIVRDGVIAEMGPVEEVTVPAGAQVVYGRGRYLAPGLIDMHVHVIARDLRTYVEHGITTVRDLAGLESVLTAAGRVARGEVAGPHIVTSSMLLNGPNPPPNAAAFAVVVSNAGAAPAAVNAQLARGVAWIKLYENLDRATYDALANAADARGAKIAGHVSGFIDVRYAMTRQRTIEHLSGYTLTDLSLAEASAAAGVYNCPTLHIFATRNQNIAARRTFVRALRDAGARILAGTDSGYLLPAGVALHNELDELRLAGLTNFEVLSAATRTAAECLGDAAIGTIAVGKRADLVLVATNPLADLSTLRRPAGVMLRGEWIPYEKRRAAGGR
jgi:imidazolonepropionase-like amidohydrolase